MKIPLSPPPFSVPEDIAPVMLRYSKTPSLLSAVDEKGRYLHWDEARHRPAPEGLTVEEYWRCLKLARKTRYQSLPFSQTNGDCFVFCQTDELQAFCHDVDREAAGHLGTSGETGSRPWQNERYLIHSLMEEAIHSSLLEGASVTRRDARKILREQREPETTDERMVVNNYKAISRIRDLVEEPLTLEMICDLHRTLTAGTMDKSDCGRIRSSDSDNPKFGVYDNRGNTLLYRPPAGRELPSGLRVLCDFANGKSLRNASKVGFLHPALHAIMVHFLLAYLHPFMDGNGRTARALFYWRMLKSHYWPLEYVSISEAICRAPQQYSRAFLHSETDEGDLTYFLLHQAAVIQKAMRSFRKFIDGKQEGLRRMQGILSAASTRQRFNMRQQELLTHAAKNPDFSYTIQSHQRRQSISYQTARTDLLTLERAGLLEQVKSGKKFLFVAPADLEQKIRSLS